MSVINDTVSNDPSPVAPQQPTYSFRRVDLQYRLCQTLHFFERTRTKYARTKYAGVHVRALVETVGARMSNGRAYLFFEYACSSYILRAYTQTNGAYAKQGIVH